MGDDSVGRYRRAYPRIWRHGGFRQLTQAEQRLALYLLTGPQTNRIGLFHFSIATASEDLDLGMDTVRKALAKVTATFGWSFDADSRVFYVPSWWRWNRPDHDKVLQGNLKDLSELPFCQLVDAFTRNLSYLDPKLHGTFLKALAIRLPQRTPRQEQEQEQKQEQGAGALKNSFDARGFSEARRKHGLVAS